MLDTSRLLLRRPHAKDAEAFFAFLGDAEAMRFTHHHVSLRERRRRLAAFEWKRRQQGYAPWAVVRKHDQQLLGWGGLYEDPFDPGWGGWSWDTPFTLPPGAKATQRSWRARV